MQPAKQQYVGEEFVLGKWGSSWGEGSVDELAAVGAKVWGGDGGVGDPAGDGVGSTQRKNR